MTLDTFIEVARRFESLSGWSISTKRDTDGKWIITAKSDSKEVEAADESLIRAMQDILDKIGG